MLESLREQKDPLGQLGPRKVQWSNQALVVTSGVEGHGSQHGSVLSPSLLWLAPVAVVVMLCG